nr:glycosyltransferase family 4 protein [Desulfuromonas sp. KJ2020]
MSPAPKILFFITEDWYFCSHRLSLAIAAKDAGYDVAVLTRVQNHEPIITNAGLRLIPSTMVRRSQNPFHEVSFIKQLAGVYQKEKPDILHHVALKPVLYGSIAARLAGCRNVVNAMAGMGFVFTSNTIKARILRPLVSISYRMLLNRPNHRLILQNRDDVALFTDSHLIESGKIALIRGAGVDTTEFSPGPEVAGPPTIVMASRLLWDKGVGEFVKAAKILRREGLEARFVLVGDSDPENPAAISYSQIDEWIAEGDIEWWGYHNDMQSVFLKANIVCLPSYREGLPKVLLEAASCGKPIVATDVPGCREIVRHCKNGLLVPPKKPAALAEALKTLILDSDLCQRMGATGRKIVEKEFSQEIVIEKTLALYREMLAR